MACCWMHFISVFCLSTLTRMFVMCGVRVCVPLIPSPLFWFRWMNGTCGVRVRQINVSFSIFRTRSRDRVIFHLILVGGFPMNAKYFYQLPYSAGIRYIYSFIYSLFHSHHLLLSLRLSPFECRNFSNRVDLFHHYSLCFIHAGWMVDIWTLKKKEITKTERGEDASDTVEPKCDGRWMRYRCWFRIRTRHSHTSSR